MLAQFLFLIADAVQTLPPEDDLPPVLLFMALCFFAVCLIVIGIGIVIGLVCLVGAAVLVGLGIVSSSALVAIWQRRFSAGLRALHYQVCAAAALPGGIFLLWLGSDLFDLNLLHQDILLGGALAGAAAGLLMAGVLDWFGRFAGRRLFQAIRLSLPVIRNI